MPVKVGLKYIDIWKESLEDQVCRYEAEPTPKGQIVFYGPSNFTRWSVKRGNTPLREAVTGASGAPCAVNRGFGSSCSEHQLYYYPRMVRPLEPRALVYAPFGNYAAFGYSIEEAWELAQRVIMYAMTDFPGMPIYICGPHARRDETEEFRERVAKGNAMVKEFVKEFPNCHFVDVYGRADLHGADIFVEDGVHYNRTGYDRYAVFFREVLQEELAKF